MMSMYKQLIEVFSDRRLDKMTVFIRLLSAVYMCGRMLHHA